MDLHGLLQIADVDRALARAGRMDVHEALAEAREVALAAGGDEVRAAATTVMARLAVRACPLPGSPTTDTAEVMEAKERELLGRHPVVECFKSILFGFARYAVTLGRHCRLKARCTLQPLQVSVKKLFESEV